MLEMGDTRLGVFALHAQIYINIYYSFLLTGSQSVQARLWEVGLSAYKCHHRQSSLTCLLISDHVVET